MGYLAVTACTAACARGTRAVTGARGSVYVIPAGLDLNANSVSIFSSLMLQCKKHLHKSHVDLNLSLCC